MLLTDRVPVYPRTYGEHIWSCLFFSRKPGLSPYLRGTLRNIPARIPCVRFIPVLTGNTPLNEHLVDTSSVYPRTYGEHPAKFRICYPDIGLSPYLRGTRRLREFYQQRSRFIPVLTGNTTYCYMFYFFTPVYPRTYGEHVTVINAEFAFLRFIPVLTGNTKTPCRTMTPTAVYPRTYGEHIFSAMTVEMISGLSPYLRGTRLHLQRWLSQGPVYPRTYGEHAFNESAKYSGSRFIPVLTGNTPERVKSGFD